MARNRANAPAAVKDAPALDLSALAEASVTVRPRMGGGRFANNPFIPRVRASYDAAVAGQNGWRGNTVPGFSARELAAALRHAGTALQDDGIGVRIRFEYTDDEGTIVEHGNVKEVPEDDRPVTVKYLGNRRRVYLTEEQTADAIARGYFLRYKTGDNKGEIMTDADGNSRIDTAAYLADFAAPVNETGTDFTGGPNVGDGTVSEDFDNGDDEYDDDESDDEYDDESDDEDDDALTG